eukprot:g6023.t1
MLTRSKRKRTGVPLLEGLSGNRTSNMGNAVAKRCKRARDAGPRAKANRVSDGGAGGVLVTARPPAVEAVSVRDERNVANEREVVAVEQVVHATAELVALGAVAPTVAERGVALASAVAEASDERWDVQHDAIVMLRRFALLHAAELAPHVAALLPPLSAAMRNLRSATMRNSVLCFGEIVCGAALDTADFGVSGAASGKNSSLIGKVAAVAVPDAGRADVLRAIAQSGAAAEVVRTLLMRIAGTDKKFVADTARRSLEAAIYAHDGRDADGGGDGDGGTRILHQVLAELLRCGTAANAHAKGEAAQCAIYIERCLGALGVGRRPGAGFAAPGVLLADLLRALGSLLGGRVVGAERNCAKKALRRLRIAVGDADFEAAVKAAVVSATDARAVMNASVSLRPKKKAVAAAAGGRALSVRERFELQKKQQQQEQAGPVLAAANRPASASQLVGGVNVL